MFQNLDRILSLQGPDILFVKYQLATTVILLHVFELYGFFAAMYKVNMVIKVINREERLEGKIRTHWVFTYGSG